MKRVAKVCVLLVVAAVLAVAGYFAAHKLYSMYQNVWDRLDELSEALDEIQSETKEIPDVAAKVEHFHRDTYFGNGVNGNEMDYSWVKKVPPYIAHACGGIDGKEYTNSREAFLLNYELGHRVFEIDFNLSEDGVLIASHDQDYWSNSIGNNLPYTSENFDKFLIHGQYETLNYAEVVELLAEYPDAYLVTDTKEPTQEEVMYAFSQLVYYAKKMHPEVLDRIIPQIYNEKMLSWVSNIYPFKSIIFTLYLADWTPESVLNFCANSGVRFITMPDGCVTEEILRLWDTMDIYVAVHTVNDQQYIDELYNMGVDMFYTDFVVPD